MDNLISAIIVQLESELLTAASASHEAHSSATHSENIADNRYDTLALEAAYLAHGQSLRITQLQESILLYKTFRRPNLTSQSAIQLGALVSLCNLKGKVQIFFIGPAAGGLKLAGKMGAIQILTSSTPLGKALMNKNVEDEVELKIGGGSEFFRIVNIQ